MAIVLAIQKCRHYLLGRKFIVRTDQKSLKFLLEQREINMEYQRWLSKLLGFDDIHYKPGIENKAVDALSRKERPVELLAMSVPTAAQFQDIEKELAQDETLKKIMGELAADPSSHPDYFVLRGRLLRRDKLVIPKESKLIGVILRELHDGRMGGHRGVQQTHKRVSELFFWTGMMKDIRRYVAACSVCQRCWTQF